jgi:hypothetical protein
MGTSAVASGSGYVDRIVPVLCHSDATLYLIGPLCIQYLVNNNYYSIIEHSLVIDVELVWPGYLGPM